MRKPIILLLFHLFICLNSLIAQEEQQASRECAKNKIRQHKSLLKVTVGDPAENDYDVLHVKMDLALTDTSVAITGHVVTTARVVANSLPFYVFELSDSLTVDSVKVNNQLCLLSTNGFIRTAAVPVALPQNAVFTADVFYHGVIAGPGGSGSTGIRNLQSSQWGNTVTYTLSEPYDSRDWWPVKQSLTDKIDSADMWITVPANLKAGSNGLLQSVTPMPGNQFRYEWKTRYKIDYYLLSVAVAAYTDYSFYAPLPNSNDSVLVQNYIYDDPQVLAFYKDKIDSIKSMMYYLSEIYGRYPFWQEKYGNCLVPLGGGMEHQTMTSQGNFGTTLTVHELAHQWFGNNVTCGTWKDIWLNEGLAAYTEYLYVDYFRGPVQAYSYMLGKQNNVLAYDTSSVYVPDTTSRSRIFDGRFTYDKGASIVHSLRFVFNNDSLFFQALRNYQQQYANSTAITEDFKNVAEQALGQDLDTFFNQWIYGKGHPVYDVFWNQVGNWVFVKLDQTTSDPSVSLFHTPIELHFYGSVGDTMIRVYNNQPSQVFSFVWNKPVTGVNADPNNWILNELGQISKDVNLNVGTVYEGKPIVYPNPTGDSWHVANLKEESNLRLMDLAGRIIWSGTAKGAADIAAGNLANGCYLLHISNGRSVQTIKLLKQ